MKASTSQPYHAVKLAYLTYLSRSGSTLLARLLDTLEDVSVSLEAEIPDGISRRGYRLTSLADADRYLSLLRSDQKFESWNVDYRALSADLEDTSFPLSFPDFLRIALLNSSSDAGAEVQVYKRGGYWMRLSPLHAADPTGRVIFIARDLRGIYASQTRTPDLRHGRSMSVSAAVTALVYRSAIRQIKRHRDATWFSLVRFEDLITRPDYEIERLAEFLGVSSCRRSNDHYTVRIPENQVLLHPLVHLPPQTSRIDGWRSEIGRRELLTLEFIAGRAMAQLGYRPSIARPQTLHEWLVLTTDVARGVFRFLGGRLKARILVVPLRRTNSATRGA